MPQGLELRIPPPAVAVLAAALMWLGAWAAPNRGFTLPGRPYVAGGVALAGAIVALLGVASFRRAKTTVNPMKPETASSLVVSGLYRRTRNPMYLGLLLILLGWAAYLSNALALALVPGFVIYMNLFQIRPEEKALASRFGSEFAAYWARVRRWI
jgi:protein-S-isoprenylcysteine O-methyltransferase Ste14